ncbi:methyl-accepting chemotaxis protein (plasmid) [Pseudoalteromonas lipolytica]|uniref:methyl-accepting chemotaxis protein n=1 Tax=Pseudoalteromonas lipolytica TaxID=570156 RepID=UPI003BA1054A
MLNNYSVRSRLAVLALLPVSIFVITSIFTISMMHSMVKGIDSLYDDRVVPLEQIKTVSDNYAVSIVDLFHKYRAEQISKTAFLQSVNEAESLADSKWQSYLSTKLTSEEQRLVNNVEKNLDNVKSELGTLLTAVKNNQLKSIPDDQFVKRLYAVFDPLSESYQGLIELQLSEAYKFKNTADKSFEKVSIAMTASVIILIIILLIVAFMIYRSIHNPLLSLSGTIGSISKNADLTLRAKTHGNDEIAQAASHFNAMMERIHTLVNDVTSATLTLSSAAEEMNSISDQVASTATEQEHQSAMIATAITQMSSAIEQVAANALATSEKASHTDKTAKMGQQSVQENIDSINRLSHIVNANTQLINELNTQSTDINQVVMMIQGVAEQTNLLALNAAIEAARAGESGRGFAVVADEVRQLAHNTQKATASINEMISKLQSMAQQAVTAMGNADESAKQSVEFAERSSQLLIEITQEMAQIADMNNQVSTATDEQTTVANELSCNINEFSSSISLVSESSQQNAQASQELASLASRLQQQVHVFKV